MLMSMDDIRELNKRKEQERLAAEAQAQAQAPAEAPAPAPAEPGLLQMPEKPMTPFEQLRDNHGTGGAILRLLGTGLSGGLLGDVLTPEIGRASQAEYASNLKAHNEATSRARLRQEQADFFNGLDPENMTLAQMAQAADYDSDIGNAMFEDYQFGRRVDDIRRAQGFMNDGVEDENDLWATETFGRHGLTAGGEQTEIDRIAAASGMTTEQFNALGTEMQETLMYQHGNQGYRDANDRLGNRKTLEQLENEAQATQQGDAIGKIDGSSIEYMHNASSIDFDQNVAMENADAIISMLENDELNTGKWQKWFKDTTGITTRADGTLGAAATENLIKQINSATFGALSEKEIEQLMQTFAQGGQSKEFNLGTMDMVKKKLQQAQEKHTRDTQRAVDRIKDNNPEEYERFMRDDDNYLRYGEGSTREPIGDLEFSTFYSKAKEKGLNRDQIDIQWNETRKRAKAQEEEAQRVAAEQAKLAEQARQELSPYIRRN